MSIVAGGVAEQRHRLRRRGGGPTLDTQASGARRPLQVRRRGQSQPRLRRGVGALGLVHPQSGPGEQAPLRPEGCHGRRRPRPDHQHGRPARTRIEFKNEWFDIHSDETPEGVKPTGGERLE